MPRYLTMSSYTMAENFVPGAKSAVLIVLDETAISKNEIAKLYFSNNNV